MDLSQEKDFVAKAQKDPDAFFHGATDQD